MNEQLKDLKEAFDGKAQITLTQAAGYLHKDIRTLKKPQCKFPYRKRGKRYLVSLVAMAKWMAADVFE